MCRSNRVPALALTFCFSFTFSFLLSDGEVSLCTCLYQLCTYLRFKIIVPRVGKKSHRIQFSCLENSNIIQSNIRRKRVVFLVIIIVQSFFSVIASGVHWIMGRLIGVCRFIHVFIIKIYIIFNGSEVRVMGTRSGFSAASVFTFAFSAKPTSV